jgi:uncharacterized membrane protein
MEGVILSAAKNPGESSPATGDANFGTQAPRASGEISTSPRFVTVTATTWIATALLLAALLPPALIRHGAPLTAMAIWAFFKGVCHQRPDRTLYLFGTPAAVCLRCLGIYAGAAVGGLFQLTRKSALPWLLAALLLNVIDVAAETMGLHGNMPLSRLLIGMTLGWAAGTMLSSGLREHFAR